MEKLKPKATRSPGWAEVLSKKGGITSRTVHESLWVSPIAAARIVKDPNARIDDKRIPSIGDALTEIDFLCVHEKSLVEPTKAPPQICINHHESARKYWDLLELHLF